VCSIAPIADGPVLKRVYTHAFVVRVVMRRRTAGASRWLRLVRCALKTSWKRILSSSLGASGAFDDAFDDDDGDAVACVETRLKVYSHWSEITRIADSG